MKEKINEWEIHQDTAITNIKVVHFDEYARQLKFKVKYRHFKGLLYEPVETILEAGGEDMLTKFLEQIEEAKQEEENEKGENAETEKYEAIQ